jgi:D-alanine transaminase
VPDIAYLNGQFLPLSEAVVSIEDRGFQFGDGVYEVVRTYGNHPFQLPAHLDRLERSAKELKLPLPVSRMEWEEVVVKALSRASYQESKIYIQVTRGPAPRDHQFPEGPAPTVVLTVREMRPLADAIRVNGVVAITMDDLRWGRCDIKSVNLLANVLARQRAKEAGAFEAIFVRSGRVTEGSVSNVLLVREGELMTAPEGSDILSGVTRSLVLDLARREGLKIMEQHPLQEDLHTASEVFLTGTTVEVLPVVRIDGKPVGTGVPGPISRLLTSRFETLTM